VEDPRAPLPAPSRATRWGALTGAFLLLPSPAFAEAPTAPNATATDPPAPGRPALERARAAWQKGDYDIAEPLYAEAIEKGGLAPDEILEAYVHLGAARAVLGKKAGALAAFRSAALLDPAFAVPSEVGKRALTIADQARHGLSKAPAASLHAQVPASIPARTAAPVDVTLDAVHAALPGSTISVLARNDGGGAHADSKPAAPAVHFDLPPSLSLPSTTLQVRVDWMDAHANRLASASEQVHVQASSSPLLAATVAPGAGADDGSRRGFWHSAWPYVLGGAALAAGGVAVYFATRSGGDVNVTGVRVITH
jgi:tetratricopeptide (TPR) repeat protein